MEKYPTKKNAVTWLILTGIIIMLLFIIWLVFIIRSTSFDDGIKDFFYGHITTQGTAFMRSITFLGNHLFLIPANLVLIALFLVLKKTTEALRVAGVALSSLGIMSLLKNLFQRHRPAAPLIDGITNYSFPSGHAFMSVAFFGLLIYYSLTYSKNKRLQGSIIIILTLIIFLIGISRVYLNVHYATDVIAGWLLGSCWLVICILWSDKLIGRNSTFYN